MTPETPPETDASDRPAGGLLRRNLAAIVVAVGLTIAVQMAVFAVARSAMAEPAASIMTLLGSLLWVVTAAPIFSASGRSLLEGLLRGGCVADASCVVLIAVGAGDALTAGGVVKAYLVWAAMALAAAALAQQAGSARGRHVLAACAVVAVLVLAASPFWANGAILAADPPWQARLAASATALSGAWATIDCLANVGFVWNEAPVLYACTVLQRDMHFDPPGWHATAVVFAAFAATLIARNILARRKSA